MKAVERSEGDVECSKISREKVNCNDSQKKRRERSFLHQKESHALKEIHSRNREFSEGKPQTRSSLPPKNEKSPTHQGPTQGSSAGDGNRRKEEGLQHLRIRGGL